MTELPAVHIVANLDPELVDCLAEMVDILPENIDAERMIVFFLLCRARFDIPGEAFCNILAETHTRFHIAQVLKDSPQ